MFYYAITLKKTVPVSTVVQAENLIKRYYSLLNYVGKANPDIHISPTLETVLKANKKHNVHLHAMVKSPRELTIALFPVNKGMHVYFEECRSAIAWQAYISKDDTSQQDVLDLIETFNEIEEYKEFPNQENNVKIYKRIV